MAFKYLIVDNKLIIGNADYHTQLVRKDIEKSLIASEGRLDLNKTDKKAYFYGTSFDYGSVTKEQFITSINNSLISQSLLEYEWTFTNDLN